MPIRTELWRVGSKPEIMKESRLASEKLLEQMIVHSPEMLSSEWLLIGQQEATSYGGIVDLLALSRDGSLVLIELKRDKAPRDVISQALDYASWVQHLQSQDILSIYSRFRPSAELATDFRGKFGVDLDFEGLNKSHQIVIVASQLDAATERIAGYLSKWDIPINVLCFQVFGSDDKQVLSRTWLLDPAQMQVNVADSANMGDKELWNGEYYCSFGEGQARSWEEALQYGFISAGGGSWYSSTLKLLEPGTRVWVNAVGYGYVGVGRVAGVAVQAESFQLKTTEGEVPALTLLKRGSYHKEFLHDEDKCEYFVPIEWLESVPLDRAVKAQGLFGNQNSICRPRASKWRTTISYLKMHFPGWDRSSQ